MRSTAPSAITIPGLFMRRESWRPAHSSRRRRPPKLQGLDLCARKPSDPGAFFGFHRHSEHSRHSWATPIRAVLRSRFKFRTDRAPTSSLIASTASRRRRPPNFGSCCWRSGRAAPARQKPTALDRFLDSHPHRQNLPDNPKAAPGKLRNPQLFRRQRLSNSQTPSDTSDLSDIVSCPAAARPCSRRGRLLGMGPNYLQTELPQRLAKSPVEFVWYAQIAEASDVIGDPSIAWPESRRTGEAGGDPARPTWLPIPPPPTKRRCSHR